ncbi:hypothetical protein RAZWK3B_16595 [Roseobacter sp. AzwK-3b]|uniref:hypothetical protein n=1 Tax=Roseobacter sp. AzwK-3b TaxID=351016 RepID=UPI0001569878|nr:hypothetical protein [Roseobacter sp. AzwK-3b]EDM71034.1 hypothetical protein RAZWK3B_16595 [Roseobacter sp. AzwK-3b]
MDEMIEGRTRSWKYRRRAAFGLLAFGCGGLAYLLVEGNDSELHRQIASGLVTIVVATIAAYIAGGVADDKFRDQHADTYRWRAG